MVCWPSPYVLYLRSAGVLAFPTGCRCVLARAGVIVMLADRLHGAWKGLGQWIPNESGPSKLLYSEMALIIHSPTSTTDYPLRYPNTNQKALNQVSVRELKTKLP